jgi:hypothetical protein
MPVRPRVAISKAITVRSSALLKRPPLDVVLDSPFVAADYAEQISHGSPSSASVSMELTLHGCASCSWIVPYFLFCQRLLRLTPPRTLSASPQGIQGCSGPRSLRAGWPREWIPRPHSASPSRAVTNPAASRSRAMPTMLLRSCRRMTKKAMTASTSRAIAIKMITMVLFNRCTPWS